MVQLNKKQKQMNVYISLPITGHDIDKQKALADKIARTLHDNGHTPINPFDSDQEGMTYGQYIGKDVAIIIDQADAVMFANGWHLSKGCNIEYQCAIHYKKKIGFYPSLKFQ